MQQLSNRILGLLLLVIGGIMFIACVIAPLSDAQQGKQSVSVYFKFTIFCPVVAGFGLVLLVLGDRTLEYLGTSDDPSLTAYILGIVLLVAGCLIYWVLKWQLESHGYQF